MPRRGDFLAVPKMVANEYPEVEDTRCVEVRIPNDDSYLPVLAAMVAALGNTWSSIGGVDARRRWAEMWQKAYAETDWSGCMNCEELIACLQPILDAQTDAILQQIENFQKFGTNNPGQPMTNDQLLENLAGSSNPGCDLDILWAQCLALVQFTNRQATDMMEKFEAVTNVVELAGLVDEIPVIGLALQFFGTELATQSINYWQEAFVEGYLAEYTEDLEIELACRLFCICRVDCIITIDRVYELFYSLVSDIVPTSPVEWVELLVMFAGIDVTDDTVVTLVFWAMWGSVKLAQAMFDTDISNSVFMTLLGLAVNDASNDWELLCISCTNYNVLQFAVYTGGAPISNNDYDWGEKEWTATDEDQPGRYVLRLEFNPAVKLNYVSHTGSQTIGVLNPAEDFYDWVDFENTFVFFEGNDLPAIDEFDGRCLKRLFLQSATPFALTIDVQPADCEPTP